MGWNTSPAVCRQYPFVHLSGWSFTIYRGEPVGLRFVRMVSETSGMGNSVRDKHVPIVQFTLIYRESGTSLTIRAGSGTGRKQ